MFRCRKVPTKPTVVASQVFGLQWLREFGNVLYDIVYRKYLSLGGCLVEVNWLKKLGSWFLGAQA